MKKALIIAMLLMMALGSFGELPFSEALEILAMVLVLCSDSIQLTRILRQLWSFPGLVVLPKGAFL